MTLQLFSHSTGARLVMCPCFGVQASQLPRRIRLALASRAACSRENYLQNNVCSNFTTPEGAVTITVIKILVKNVKY